MSKKAFYHNERRRHHYASPSDSRNNTNCASLSCDVDAKISCGGKTFQSKLIGNDGKERYSITTSTRKTQTRRSNSRDREKEVNRDQVHALRRYYSDTNISKLNSTYDNLKNRQYFEPDLAQRSKTEIPDIRRKATLSPTQRSRNTYLRALHSKQDVAFPSTYPALPTATYHSSYHAIPDMREPPSAVTSNTSKVNKNNSGIQQQYLNNQQVPPQNTRGGFPPPQSLTGGPQNKQVPGQTQIQGNQPPSIPQLQEMARRQQQQIEAQQQLLVAKEQRLKYLRQQDYRHHQMAAEYERLRRLREKVESQELKLRKLRALRGQPNPNMQHQQPQNPQNNASVTADLESIRSLFNEKEKELSMAVSKVEELTVQLEDLRTGRGMGGGSNQSSNTRYPPQLVELERLRRELAYRKQLNEQQNNMISQQRAQLAMGQEEMMKIDDRIVELQERLARKRMMNQQLASQISAATNAKQAQLRAIQQGMVNKNKHKPVSTVEPFQRHHQAPPIGQMPSTTAHQPQNMGGPVIGGMNNQQLPQHMYKDVDMHNKINSMEDIQQPHAHPHNPSSQQVNKNDPKYQTLPFNTKFGNSNNSNSNTTNLLSNEKSEKIRALKQEKENNNIQFSEDLPPPPPLPVSMANMVISPSSSTSSNRQLYNPDYQGNYTAIANSNEASTVISGNTSHKPISSVAPVVASSSSSTLGYQTSRTQPNEARSSDVFSTPTLSAPQSSSTPINQNYQQNFANSNTNNNSSNNEDNVTKSKPALPPKPPASQGSPDGSPQPPPYIPAPPPGSSGATQGYPTSNSNFSKESVDSAITILRGGSQPPNSMSSNLSVSAYPHPAEEGTSVDDDAPMMVHGNQHLSEEEKGSGLTVRPPGPNVHISINRRIEMPSEMHFPEGEAPPLDLLGQGSQGVGADDGSGGTGAVSLPRDVTDNASLYPMMNQIYKEFDHLSSEEQAQIKQMFVDQMTKRGHMDFDEDNTGMMDVDDEKVLNVVPDVYEESDSGGSQDEGKPKKKPKPPGIICREKGIEGATSHSRRVMFDPLALLLDASLEGELELVKRTAKQVQDPSAANDEGITALHNAICAGHLDIVQFLVEFGCDVNAQDSDGWTPLHCAASCNNLPMVRFLVEHGACIFATTLSDHETAAEKCEEDEEGFDGCSEYLYSIQEKLGTINQGAVYAVYDYEEMSPNMTDELTFKMGDKLQVMRKGDEVEREWWWAKRDTTTPESSEETGYIPRNLLGLHPRVSPNANGNSDVENENVASINDKNGTESEMELGKENDNVDSDDAKMSSS